MNGRVRSIDKPALAAGTIRLASGISFLVDPVRANPEPLFRFLKGIRRKIEYRYPAEALLKQAINKP